MEKAGIPGYTYSNAAIVESNYTFLKKDDKILKIDSRIVKDWRDIEFILDNRVINQEVDLTIKRNKEILNERIKLTPYYDISYLIVIILVSAVFLIPGIYIYIKNPSEKFTLIFHWQFMAVVGMILLNPGSLLVFDDTFNLITRSVYILSMIATPIIFIHISFYFPRKKWEFRNYLMILLYIYTFIVTLICVIKFNIVLQEKTLNAFHEFLNFYKYWSEFLFVPALLVIVANFVHSYLKFKDEAERRKLLWISTGFIAGASGYGFLYVLPRYILGYPLLSETLMILLLVIGPVSYYFAVTSYRFLDIELIVNKAIVFTSVLGSFLVICFLFYFLVLQFFDIKFERYYLTAMIIGFIIAFLLQPFKRKMQTIIDKNFFRIKYNLENVHQDFLNHIRNCVSINQISLLIKKTISDFIPVNEMAVVIYNNNQKKLNISESDNCHFDNDTLEKLYDVIKNNKTKLPFAKKELLEDGIVHIKLKDTPDNLCPALIFSHVNTENILKLVLIIGEKKSHLTFTHEDISILQNIVYHAGNAIDKLDLQEELIIKQQETQKLSELNELKSFFVSNVSHELKTPLTSIKLFAELLNNKKNLPDTKKRNYLDIIEGECDRLDRLINNLLDFARIEKGNKQYNFKQIDLKESVQNILEYMDYQLKINKFTYKFEFDDGDYKINADPDAIMEVIINLITNVMKYSNEKKDFLIKLYSKNNNYNIDISDKGIGISPEEIKKIFEPFYRSENSKSLSTGGAGIGLSISSQIMAAHKGNIEVSSILGIGSTFTLNFPREIKQ